MRLTVRKRTRSDEEISVNRLQWFVDKELSKIQIFEASKVKYLIKKVQSVLLSPGFYRLVFTAKINLKYIIS